MADDMTGSLAANSPPPQLVHMLCEALDESPVDDSTQSAFRRIGAGHIHHTWVWLAASGAQYVCQEINTGVFTDPHGLMDNIHRVQAHFAEAIDSSEALCLPDYLSHQNSTLWWPQRDSGETLGDGAATKHRPWRVMRWIDHAYTRNDTPQDREAASSGAAFGRFLHCLDDFAQDLKPPIEGFFDLEARLHALQSSVAVAPAERLALAGPWLSWVEDHQEDLPLPDLQERVIHGDCKINNVLFDQTGQAIALVDLDTVIYAHPALDLGDLLRAATSTAAEDEPDPLRVQIHEGRFSAMVPAYLAALSAQRREELRPCVVPAAFHMALMLGARFLSDYLAGDVYFPVQHAQHNLHRAATQLTLAQRFSTHQGSLQRLF